MSTSAPANDGELIRSFNERLNKLENSSTTRVGNYVLADKSGELVATAAGAAPISLSNPATETADLTGLATTDDVDSAIAAALSGIDTDDGGGDIVSQIIEALLGEVGDLLDLKAWAELIPLLSDPIALGGKLLAEILPNINAATLFGTIRADLLSILPVGALSAEAPNRLADNGTFPADAIAPADDWEVDMSTSQTPSDGTGSAHVVADGLPHRLRTGSTRDDKLTVATGQTISESIYVSHTGAIALAGGQPPVLLQIQPFNEDALLPVVTLASYSPSSPNVAWPGALISGTYVIPAGTTHYQGCVALTEAAYQGDYHFDAAKTTQMGDLSVIPGLSAALQTLNASWRSGMDAIASAARGFPIIGAEVADVVTAIENFNPLNLLGSLGSNNLAGDLGGIIGHLIDAVKGHPAGTTTTGSLADLYTAMNMAFHNTDGQDVTQFVDTTTLVPVDPTWANWIDAVGVGEGQRGATVIGLPIPGLYGQGGHPGKFSATTWHKGEHYDNTLTGVQVTFNSDGSVTLAIPGHTITCQPGTGALSTSIGGGWAGKGPGAFPYNGKPYAGGGDQNTAGAAGAGPGGAGAGGTALFFQDGGPGGPAGAWVRQRADDVADPSTGSDTTGPGDPTSIVVTATNSGLTFVTSGSVDA